MTPAEIRHTFGETIDYYRRTWGADGQARAAKLILDALAAYPWLNDQIPHDVLRLAQRDGGAL